MYTENPPVSHNIKHSCFSLYYTMPGYLKHILILSFWRLQNIMLVYSFRICNLRFYTINVFSNKSHTRLLQNLREAIITIYFIFFSLCLWKFVWQLKQEQLGEKKGGNTIQFKGRPSTIKNPIAGHRCHSCWKKIYERPCCRGSRGNSNFRGQVRNYHNNNNFRVNKRDVLQKTRIISIYETGLWTLILFKECKLKQKKWKKKRKGKKLVQ